MGGPTLLDSGPSRDELAAVRATVRAPPLPHVSAPVPAALLLSSSFSVNGTRKGRTPSGGPTPGAPGGCGPAPVVAAPLLLVPLLGPPPIDERADNELRERVWVSLQLPALLLPPQATAARQPVLARGRPWLLVPAPPTRVRAVGAKGGAKPPPHIPTPAPPATSPAPPLRALLAATVSGLLVSLSAGSGLLLALPERPPSGCERALTPPPPADPGVLGGTPAGRRGVEGGGRRWRCCSENTEPRRPSLELRATGDTGPAERALPPPPMLLVTPPAPPPLPPQERLLPMGVLGPPAPPPAPLFIQPPTPPTTEATETFEASAFTRPPLLLLPAKPPPPPPLPVPAMLPAPPVALPRPVLIGTRRPVLAACRRAARAAAKAASREGIDCERSRLTSAAPSLRVLSGAPAPRPGAAIVNVRRDIASPPSLSSPT